MKLPTLFHIGHSGVLYSWKVQTVGDTILQEYGTVDGEKTHTSKAVKGKNIGKTNETSPKEQATREAKSLWQKKKDTKYSETPGEAAKTIFLPMLASDLKKRKKPLEYPVDVQPKLDGARCMAFWRDNEVVLMSRSGKQWNVPHIKKALEKYIPWNFITDGELYIHDIMLQDILHLVKSPDEPEAQSQLEYRIFDGFHLNGQNAFWHIRYEDLDFELKASKFGPPLYIVPRKEIYSLEELEIAKKEYENLGYEGLIIRLQNAPYELGFRSKFLWKYKSFIDEEFEIVNYTEASGNDIGTVVWECKTKEGQTFSVRPKGTRDQRRLWFLNGDNYIGRQLKVKYQKRTNDNIPEFPVGIAIREPEDM